MNDLHIDPEKVAALAAYTFAGTEVLKNYVKLSRRGVRIAAFVIAILIAVGQVFIADSVPAGKELARAVFSAVLSAVSAVLIAKARSAGGAKDKG